MRTQTVRERPRNAQGPPEAASSSLAVCRAARRQAELQFVLGERFGRTFIAGTRTEQKLFITCLLFHLGPEAVSGDGTTQLLPKSGALRPESSLRLKKSPFVDHFFKNVSYRSQT